MKLKSLLYRTVFHVSNCKHSVSTKHYCTAITQHVTPSFATPEIPQIFQRLFSDQVLRDSFEQNSSNLTYALNTIHQYNQSNDKSIIINTFSTNTDYLNDIVSYMIQNTYSDDILEFITFCDQLQLLQHITPSNMENIMDILLHSGKIHHTIEIGLKYNNNCITASMHETIGMSICSTPWTDAFHHSLHPFILQWFKILTKQYIQYFKIHPKPIIDQEGNDSLDDIENEEIPLIRPKFESFFIYITHLLARDGMDHICKDLLRVIEPIIINVEYSFNVKNKNFHEISFFVTIAEICGIGILYNGNVCIFG